MDSTILGGLLGLVAVASMRIMLLWADREQHSLLHSAARGPTRAHLHNDAVAAKPCKTYAYYIHAALISLILQDVECTEMHFEYYSPTLRSWLTLQTALGIHKIFFGIKFCIFRRILYGSPAWCAFRSSTTNRSHRCVNARFSAAPCVGENISAPMCTRTK